MKSLLLFLHLGALTQALLQEGTIRILCFGDSLTSGFTDHGSSRHPYAGALLSSLHTSFPSLNIVVDNHGQSGDQVKWPEGSFLPRISSVYADEDYDYAVILGGTNDLWQWREADVIFEALQKVWDVPLSHGSRVLSLSVPDCGNTPWEINEKRDTLNELIMGHEADAYFTLDLSRKIPFFAMPEERRREIWDDGTHFTPRGYDLVGRTIASRIVELVKEDDDRMANSKEAPLIEL